VTPVKAVFSYAPCHDAAELVLAYNVGEFAGYQGGSIPGPEELVGGVEVVLAAGGLVGDAVGEGGLPAARDVGVGAAGAEGVLAGAGAVLWGGAAVAVLGTAA
jgi:hypothetical protein